MKKYFIAVAALAFLAACNGKAAKDTPVLVEEESIAVAEAAPDAPSLPELPVVKQTGKAGQYARLLETDPKGAVVQKYKGTIPAAWYRLLTYYRYDLTLFYQQDSDDGVYEFERHLSGSRKRAKPDIHFCR